MGIPKKDTETPKIELYDSINVLPLWNFDRYLSTHDNNWFRVGFKGHEPKIDTPEMKDVENSLVEEYFNAIDDRSFQNKLQKWAKIDDLTKVYNVVSKILETMSQGFEDTVKEQEVRIGFINLLKTKRFVMPLFNSPSGDKEHIQRLFVQLQGIKTQISIIQGELKDDGKKEQRNLFRQIVIAKSALPGYEMNPRTMVVSEWIEICKQLEEISKKN